MPSVRRRTFLAGSVASLAAASLSGCSDDGQGGPDKPTGDSSRADVRRFRGEIVVATLRNPPERARNALAAAYRRHQPDVRIRWETRDWSDTEAYADWLGAELDADAIRPDIVSSSYVRDFRGYVNLEEHRKQTNPYTGNGWDEDYRFDRYPELTISGKRVQIGTESEHLLWYYNQDLFADLELTPPTTWSQLVDVCRTLKQSDVVPVSANFDYVLPNWLPPLYFDQYHSDWVETVRVREGDWNWDPARDAGFEYDPSDPRLHAKYTYSPQRFYKGLRDKELRYDTEAFAELVDNLTKVFPAYSNPDLFVRDDQYTPFLQGEAAMMIDGSWALSQLTEDLEGPTPERLDELGISANSVRRFEWGVFDFPGMRGDLVRSENVRPPERATGYFLGAVDKDAERTAMVLDFLMFWISEPGYQAFVDGLVEADELEPQGPPLVEGVTYPAEIDELFQNVERKGVVGPKYGGFWVAGAGGKTSEDLQSLFVDALRGRSTPTEYGKQVQRYIQNNLDAFLRQASLTDADVANPARRPQSF